MGENRDFLYIYGPKLGSYDYQNWRLCFCVGIYGLPLMIICCSEVKRLNSYLKSINSGFGGHNFKGEKADSVYPGYGRDPEDPANTGDPEDTITIQRIQLQSRGYM